MTRPNVYVKNMDSPKHMELKNRIKAVCVIFKLSVREFERECQLNRGNISNMTGALGSDKISKIIARYPSINLYWLLTGEGEMFLSRSEKTGSDAPGDEESAQRDEPAKAETIDRPANRTQEGAASAENDNSLLQAHRELIGLLRTHIRLQNEQLRLQNDQLRLLDEMIERIKNKGKVL